MPRYADIADQMRAAFAEGRPEAGARLPGVRRLAHQYGVSVSTIVAAMQRLEDEGWVEARPRSGFFVRPRRRAGADLPASRPDPRPAAVTSQAITLEIVQASAKPGVLQLGTAVPDTSFMPAEAVQRALASASRLHRRDALGYAFPPGVLALREAVAARLADGGCSISPDEVLITSGAQEATQLALRSVAAPGDVVAVESPTYYGLLQVIESLGLTALEIPTDPRRGIDLPAFERALELWPIRALALVPHCSNPTGYVMAEADRRALVNSCAWHDVPIIEDDVYADLAVEADGSGLRPRALKAVDPDAVFLCGSASKTVAPGLRVGWLAAPARHRERLEYLKYAGTLSASPLAQYALAEIYEGRGIGRHLRQVRARYAERTTRTAERLLDALPEGSIVSDPDGGFVLWIQCPPDVDAIQLYRAAAEEHIVIAPGPIFSASGRYENCLRLNVAVEHERDLERAVVRLGILADRIRSGGMGIRSEA